MMPELKFYADLMSQPCRAVYLFLKMNNVPYEDKGVKIHLDGNLLHVNQTDRVLNHLGNILSTFSCKECSSQIGTCIGYLKYALI